MAENTAIEWCDMTFNPWEGCQKVAPECDNCYAEARNERFHGGENWGPKAPRRRTSAQNWNKPRRWNREAEAFHTTHGRRQRVFCASLADVFDNAVDPAWRADLFDLIRETPDLDWLLLTKRPHNMVRMLPDDWGDGWAHVWLGTSAGSQKTADTNIPALLATPAAVRFVSAEPMLGPVDLAKWVPGCFECAEECGWRAGPAYLPEEDCSNGHRSDGTHEFCQECGTEMGVPVCPDCGGRAVHWLPNTPCLDWVICGGESGPNARPMHPDWARSLRDQCAAAMVPFLFKQWGEWTPAVMEYDESDRFTDGPVLYPDEKVVGPVLTVDDEREWEWRIWLPDGSLGYWTDAPDDWCDGREIAAVSKLGKKRAGRLLDGRTWDQMPGALT